MKKKVLRILGVAVTLVMVCSLAVALAPAAPANEVSADPGSQKWTKFTIPRPADLSGYVLTGTDNTSHGPGPLAKAIDGTLYVYWDISETDNLFKSTDNGRTWERCSSSTDELPDAALVDIAVSREDPNLVYVCSTTTVYRSSNAGDTFTAISPLTAYLNAGDELITSLAAGFDGSSHWIVVGTDNGTDGEVYIKQDPYLGPWQDQDMTADRSVLKVACAPDFSSANPLIVAVTDNGSAAFLQYQYSGGAWTHETNLEYDPAGLPTGANVTHADIAFPSDFNSLWPNPDLFVGISCESGEGGDVYHIYADYAYDLDIDGTSTSTNVTSVALAGSMGDTMLLAGTLDESNVFHSEDDGETWKDSKYDPSGQSKIAYVEVSDDYYDSGIGWAALCGEEGAFSQTHDYGIAWYQISLINTNIAAVTDLAPSPEYAEDSTLFMLTDNATGGSTSVWKSATYWERVSENITADHIEGKPVSIQVSPKFGTDSAVFVADKVSPKIWRSTDGGFRFKKQAGYPNISGTAKFGAGWQVIDSSTLLVSGGTDSVKVLLTENNGTTWSAKTASGANNAFSFALSPNYDEDTSILMGDSGGAVYLSTNGGSKWTRVPEGEVVDAEATTVYVAFDSDYADNDIIYASAPASTDIFRLEAGKDTTWKDIAGRGSTTWPGTPQNVTDEVSVLVTGNGVLYASDNGTANADKVLPEDLPALRSQNPTASRTTSRGVYFEAMAGSWDTLTATGLWITAGDGTNVLWTIAGGNSIWTYEDNLIVSPTLTGPEEGFTTGREATAKLQWEELPNATYYFVWVSTDDEFSVSEMHAGALAVSTKPWNTTTSTTAFTVKELSAGKTYYWKIATADSQWGNYSETTAYDSSSLGKALSPWSEIRSFSTGIAGGEWNPFMTSDMFPGNVAPPAGGTNVPLRPTFQWNSADWATGYEFVLSDNPAYNPIVSLTGANALKTPTYALDKDLNYSTTYYWKVRAISETTESKWGEGVFTTMAQPAVPPAPPAPQPPVTIPPAPAPITPAYIWAIIGIGAILVIAVIVLIVRTRRVV